MADKMAEVNSDNTRGGESADRVYVQESALRTHSAAVGALATACLLGGIAALDFLLLKWRSSSEAQSRDPVQFSGHIPSAGNSDALKRADSRSVPHSPVISFTHESAATQSEIARSHDSWIEPRPQTIPRPTYSPAVLALAIVCLLWGIVTTYLISLLGMVLFVAGLAGWIGELRHEHESNR